MFRVLADAVAVHADFHALCYYDILFPVIVGRTYGKNRLKLEKVNGRKK